MDVSDTGSCIHGPEPNLETTHLNSSLNTPSSLLRTNQEGILLCCALVLLISF